MKISFVLNRGYSLFHSEFNETYGGAQIDQYLLGAELNKKGHSVSFVFHDYGQIDVERTVGNIILYKSYPPKDSGFLIFQFFRASYKLYKTLRRINADAYFLEGANFELFIVAIYCRLRRKKIYYRLASDIEADGRYEQENLFQGWLYKIGRILTTKIIAQTDKQFQLLRKRGIQSIIIPNAYPSHNLRGDINGPILWVGRLIRLKQPEIFLDIADHLPDKQFILIGQPETIDQEYATNILKRIKKTRNIQYLPKINFGEIDHFFQQSSLLINSSTYEGFPMTFLQAMSFGVPIISFGVNPDGILDKVGGACVSSIEQSVQAITRYGEEAAWETSSNISQEYFSKHFSLDLVMTQYEALLSKK